MRNWLLAIPILFAEAFLIYAFSEDFYQIVIVKNPAYPFGLINENPWYHESLKIFGIVTITEIFLYLTLFIITLIFLFRRENRKIIFSLAGFFLLLALTFINSRIQ